MTPVVRSLLEDIVGEASAQLLKLSPDGLGDLPLRQAVGVRNILVHGYAKVRMEEIILIVRNSLPTLVEAARRLLTETEQTP
jgi:uncharacterized protein with HEPN domain